MPVWLDSSESTLPGMQMTAFLLCCHMAERKRERDKALWSLIRALILNEDPTLMTSSKPNYLPNTITLEVRAATYKFCRDTIQPIAASKKIKLEIFNKLLKAECGLVQEYKAPGGHRHKKSLHLLHLSADPPEMLPGTYREDQRES